MPTHKKLNDDVSFLTGYRAKVLVYCKTKAASMLETYDFKAHMTSNEPAQLNLRGQRLTEPLVSST